MMKSPLKQHRRAHESTCNVRRLSLAAGWLAGWLDGWLVGILFLLLYSSFSREFSGLVSCVADANPFVSAAAAAAAAAAAPATSSSSSGRHFTALLLLHFLNLAALEKIQKMPGDLN